MTKVGTKQIQTLHGPLQPLQRSTTGGTRVVYVQWVCWLPWPRTSPNIPVRCMTLRYVALHFIARQQRS